MNVDIWSDVACPWCYIGKRRFDVALTRFEHRDAVVVRWRSFELDRSAPVIREEAYLDKLAVKYRITLAEADAMIDRMIEAGAQQGVVLRFDKAKPGNTFDAHRLLHLAAEQETQAEQETHAERGVQADVAERMFHATFTKGFHLGDHDVLAGVAEAGGLDPEEVRAVLDSDRFATEVRADEQRAADLGITSVPFFVLGGTLGVVGAQPPEVLLGALRDAWAEAHVGGEPP